MKRSWLLFLVLLLAACRQRPSPATPTPPPTEMAVPAPSETVVLWPGEAWPTSTPEEQGMDSEKLARLFDYVEEQDHELHSLLVIRNGRAVLDANFYPHPPDAMHILHSVTKSVTSALVGIAIDEGYLDGVAMTLPELLPSAQIDEEKRAISLEHLLTMTSGLRWNEAAPYGSRENSYTAMRLSDDWTAFVLERPSTLLPGQQFVYSTGGSHLLSAALTEQTGQDTRSFAEGRLFGPLGIDAAHWYTSTDGVYEGGAGLSLQPGDMARIGYLYLHDGVWEGQQIIPADWVQRSTEPQIQPVAGAAGYGYQWWIDGFGGYSARGSSGQRIHVIPDAELIVVMTAGLSTVETARNIPGSLVDFFILSAVKSDEPLPPNPDGLATLQEHIQAAAAPPEPLPVTLPETAAAISGRVLLLEPSDLGWEWATLDFKDDVATLTVDFPDAVITFDIGLDGRYAYTESDLVQMAARGEWTDNQTFEADVQPLGATQGMTIWATFNDETARIRVRPDVGGRNHILNGRFQE